MSLVALSNRNQNSRVRLLVYSKQEIKIVQILNVKQEEVHFKESRTKEINQKLAINSFPFSIPNLCPVPGFSNTAPIRLDKLT